MLNYITVYQYDYNILEVPTVLIINYSIFYLIFPKFNTFFNKITILPHMGVYNLIIKYNK